MNGRRVHFLEDYDYKPSPQITIAYKAGDVKLVRLECAQKAVALGKAEYTATPIPKSGIASRIKKSG